MPNDELELDDTPQPAHGDEDQPALFEAEADWKDLWRGMPEYSQENLEPWQSVLVHFRNRQDRQQFADLIEQQLLARTKFVWYPKATIGTAADKIYRAAQTHTPRYPIYIISKGRWETRQTSKALEMMRVPYHIVIEPQEYDKYAAVIDPAKILVLPFSNLGQGGIPARNWVWEHAVGTGAARHWILDDNISGFCRFHNNMKIEVDSGVTFCAIEDFSDRYENVVMSGFNYDYFAPRKQGAGIRPFTLNTRIYSGILLRNDLPHRWRGRYNEDTDLSLRILKDGLCTVLFNAFLMYKAPTLTMKGGNSEELYKGAGRLAMAESLRDQHPDCVDVVWKWDRWQHRVDYRKFRGNKLILKQGVVIPDTGEQYAMVLEMLAVADDAVSEPTQDQSDAAYAEPADKTPRKPKAPTAAPLPSTPAGPSALDFLSPLVVQTDVVVADPDPSPDVFRDSLLERGHRLLTKDGKLFTTRASALGERDRQLLKQYKAELLLLADPYPEPPPPPAGAPPPPPKPVAPSVHLDAPPAPASAPPSRPNDNTLIEFLSATANPAPPAIHRDWVPDEIPSLEGLDDLVLNFATTGLEWAATDRPVGVTIGPRQGGWTPRFLPFAFQGGGNLDEAQVKEWARRELRGKKITGANLRFDLHQARAWGVDLTQQHNTFSDVMHTAALLDDHRKIFKLDRLIADYLPDLLVVGRVDETRHATYHAAEVAVRERFTVEACGRLTQTLYPQLAAQDLLRVQALEDGVIPVVVEMEKNGALLDMDLLDQFHRECTEREQALLWAVSKECGFSFTRNSEGWKRLFERYQLPLTFLAVKEKNGQMVQGKETFADDILAAIDHPVIQQARLSAQLASLNSKTFKAYKDAVDGNGILRVSINQLRSDDAGTVSGRFSAGLIQQVPNHDNHAAVFGEDLNPRRLFISQTGIVAAADAAQIEFRLFAHHAKNPRVMAAYAADPTISFHREIMSMLVPFKPDLQYGGLKSLNFATIYGAGLPKTAVMMKFITDRIAKEISDAHAQHTDPRLAEAREVRAIYDRVLPEVAPLLRLSSHLAQESCTPKCKPHDALHRYPHRGFVKTILGRRSRFPSGHALHKALNRVIQGSGADIMKQKLIELYAQRADVGLLLRMTVHDEVTGDAAGPETLPKMMQLLNTQSFPELRVPILWEGKTGATWADCK